MARRILNRMDMRADFEAAERRKREEEEVEGEEEEEGEEDEEEASGEDEEGEEEEEGEEDEEEEEYDEDGEPIRKKKKKKKKEVVKPVAKPKRTRTAKVPRLRVVWKVFNNSNQPVATYEYSRKTEADEHAARMTAEKKMTYFVQPVKEPIEEK